LLKLDCRVLGVFDESLLVSLASPIYDESVSDGYG